MSGRESKRYVVQEAQEGGEEARWRCLEWGLRGGPQAREVALWVQLQREIRRRGLLPVEAVARLSTLGFQWATQARPFAIEISCRPYSLFAADGRILAVACRSEKQNNALMLLR